MLRDLQLGTRFPRTHPGDAWYDVGSVPSADNVTGRDFTVFADGAGEVLAIKDDSLSTQFLVYRDTSDYKPIALDVLPAEDPE